ncbi:hypothetical protein T09_11151 [Trichinella sp. T9]|nr:hypothetical protein T09_11151 [Trichinella sp. T9]KRZ87383.1 hypothetical protein T08_258 [Trichinella sp. T8]
MSGSASDNKKERKVVTRVLIRCHPLFIRVACYGAICPGCSGWLFSWCTSLLHTSHSKFSVSQRAVCERCGVIVRVAPVLQDNSMSSSSSCNEPLSRVGSFVNPTGLLSQSHLGEMGRCRPAGSSARSYSPFGSAAPFLQ